MDISEYKQLFLNEAGEILRSANNVLINLEKDPENIDLLNELFRQSHTLKSMAQSMKYEDIARLTHSMETILSLLRNGQLRTEKLTVDLLFNSLDTLSVLLEEVKDNKKKNVSIKPLVTKLDQISEFASDEEEKQNNNFSVSRNQAVKKILSTVTSPEAQTVRVPLSQLDSLIDIAGELAINKTRLSRITKTIDNSILDEAINEISRLTSQFQEHMIKIRLVPLEYIFTPYPRLIRDMASTQKKQVDLIIEGSHIGMDRTIQSEINESLLHLLKNAVTHGSESREKRKKLKKPERSKLKLSARREGDFVLIELSDDGPGMDVDQVKKNALAKGIVTQEELSKMSHQESVMLITRPEYSGAKKVTEAAGRGVGLNAVRSKIESFGGTLSINTRLNKGTTFIIKLPLTMAIIQVILVGIADETYGIPVSYISETIKISTGDIRTVEGREMISYRDTVLPLVKLKLKLGFTEYQKENKKNIPVIVVQSGTSKIGLVVDSLLGQQEAVIKPLNGLLKQIKGVSGATILSTGKISFIVDILSVI